MAKRAEEDLVVVSVRCTPETAEAVHAVFHEVGVSGTVEEAHGDTVVVTAYLPASSSWNAVVSAVADRLPAVRAAFGAQVEGPAVTVLAAEDWTEAWKKHYKLVRVGRIVIKPSWAHAPPEAEIIVELDPQMAFGSGAHSSTRLALQALQDVGLDGAVIADVGTGTGVLAIAAAKLGASRVYATDYDPIAVRAARQNVARNGVGDVVEVSKANLLRGVPRGLDGVVANISPAADCKLAGVAKSWIKPGGWLILSGFTEASEERLLRALDFHGYTLERRYCEGEWLCFTAHRLNAEQ